jgi:hypothetical protein
MSAHSSNTQLLMDGETVAEGESEWVVFGHELDWLLSHLLRRCELRGSPV